MNEHRAIGLLALLLLAVAPARVVAQSEKLAGRFPPAAEATLRSIVDSAHAQGLPTEPLVQRALEGGSRGVEAGRVVAAVRALRGRLGVARQALGPSATEAELVAAASTLYLGVAPDTLAMLRRQQASRNLALPLVVLADMIQQGVPKDTATGILLSLTGAGIGDDSYRALRQAVQLDIRSGVPPATSAAMRARGALLALPDMRPAKPHPL
jgi:hypothetical protein